MSLAAAATRFNAITDAIRSMMTASSSADVNIEGVLVPSLRKQIATESGTFLFAKTAEVNASARLAASYAQSASSALALMMQDKNAIDALATDVQNKSRQTATHAATVAS